MNIGENNPFQSSIPAGFVDHRDIKNDVGNSRSSSTTQSRLGRMEDRSPPVLPANSRQPNQGMRPPLGGMEFRRPTVYSPSLPSSASDRARAAQSSRVDNSQLVAKPTTDASVLVKLNELKKSNPKKYAVMYVTHNVYGKDLEGNLREIKSNPALNQRLIAINKFFEATENKPKPEEIHEAALTLNAEPKALKELRTCQYLDKGPKFITNKLSHNDYTPGEKKQLEELLGDTDNPMSITLEKDVPKSQPKKTQTSEGTFPEKKMESQRSSSLPPPASGRARADQPLTPPSTHVAKPKEAAKIVGGPAIVSDTIQIFPKRISADTIARNLGILETAVETTGTSDSAVGKGAAATKSILQAFKESPGKVILGATAVGLGKVTTMFGAFIGGIVIGAISFVFLQPLGFVPGMVRDINDKSPMTLREKIMDFTNLICGGRLSQYGAKLLAESTGNQDYINNNLMADRYVEKAFQFIGSMSVLAGLAVGLSHITPAMVAGHSVAAVHIGYTHSLFYTHPVMFGGCGGGGSGIIGAGRFGLPPVLKGIAAVWLTFGEFQTPKQAEIANAKSTINNVGKLESAYNKKNEEIEKVRREKAAVVTKLEQATTPKMKAELEEKFDKLSDVETKKSGEAAIAFKAWEKGKLDAVDAKERLDELLKAE